MLYGRLIKPCKICIYEQKEEGGEVESFSLLKLNLKEVYYLLSVAFKEYPTNNETKNIEAVLDGSIVIKYSGNDDIHKAWKELAQNHLKNNPKEFRDISKKYKTDIPGTSCLIRDANKHIIKISLRKGDDTCTINRMCIDNEIRERFFQDAKASKYFKQTKKYALDTQDLNTYTYWSKFMNSSYLEQSKNLSN